MTARILVLIILGVTAFVIAKIASMKLKHGADIENVSWRMFYAAIIVEGVLKKYGASEAVITSGGDGTHSATSKHYPENNPSGMVEALDFRRWEVNNPEAARLEIKEKLGPDYDVVIEKTHFHVEYDPK